MLVPSIIVSLHAFPEAAVFLTGVLSVLFITALNLFFSFKLTIRNPGLSYPASGTLFVMAIGFFSAFGLMLPRLNGSAAGTVAGGCLIFYFAFNGAVSYYLSASNTIRKEVD